MPCRPSGSAIPSRPPAPSIPPRSNGRCHAAPAPAPRAGALGLALLLAGSLAACSEAETHAIEPGRILEPSEGGDFLVDATPAQRFGLEPMGGMRRSSAPHWETPAGWVDETAARAPQGGVGRVASFRIGEDTECYLTVLAGDGGGLEANVNRWRSQMSLPPLSPAEIAAAPRVPFFGGEGLLVDFEGTFTGMGGTEQGTGYRLLGLLALAGGEARFLKMTGPAEVVAREREAFLALGASFHADHEGGHDEPPAGDPHAGLAGVPPVGSGVDPHAGLAGVPPVGGVGGGAGGLTWEAPEGWRLDPERGGMRLVTYHFGPPEDPDAAECFVMTLAGDGGGAFANANRWCTQMEAPEMTRARFDALERVPMLGGEGVLVEVAGRYRGMGEEDVADALLLGAIRELEGRAVFVKLVGPAAVVEPQREAFLEFCGSLEEAGR